MAHYRQIIVGQGISALTFAKTSSGVQPIRPRSGDTPTKNADIAEIVCRKNSSEVMTPDYLDGKNDSIDQPLLIGQTDQWQKFNFPKNSVTGQPGQLHQLPNKNPAPTTSGFSSLNELAGKIKSLKEDVSTGQIAAFGEALVERVTKIGPGKLKVKLRGTNEDHTAEQVIIACGPGPEREPDYKIMVNRPEPNDQSAPYSRLLSGVDFLFEKPSRYNQGLGIIVSVQGGSATAAWVCEKAMQFGNQVIWHTRPEGTKFDLADPAGRNTHTISQFKDVDEKFSFPKFATSTDGYIKFLDTPKRVKFDKDFINIKFERRSDFIVHRYIYCLGADPAGMGGPRNILDEAIYLQMKPYYDIDQMFPVSEGAAVLALCTKERDVWVVGSALHQALGLGKVVGELKNVSADYAKLRDTLPAAAGKPVEGLAGAVASIEALNNYISEGISEGVDINLSTSNRTQIAVYLANHAIWGDLKGSVRDNLVNLILDERKLDQFGKVDFQKIIMNHISGNEGIWEV